MLHPNWKSWIKDIHRYRFDVAGKRVIKMSDPKIKNFVPFHYTVTDAGCNCIAGNLGKDCRHRQMLAFVSTYFRCPLHGAPKPGLPIPEQFGYTSDFAGTVLPHIYCKQCEQSFILSHALFTVERTFGKIGLGSWVPKWLGRALTGAEAIACSIACGNDEELPGKKLRRTKVAKRLPGQLMDAALSQAAEKYGWDHGGEG